MLCLVVYVWFRVLPFWLLHIIRIFGVSFNLWAKSRDLWSFVPIQKLFCTGTFAFPLLEEIRSDAAEGTFREESPEYFDDKWLCCLQSPVLGPAPICPLFVSKTVGRVT